MNSKQPQPKTILISQIGIALSCNWKFPKAPPPLDQNSLMVGVACGVCRPWVPLGEDERWPATAAPFWSHFALARGAIQGVLQVPLEERFRRLWRYASGTILFRWWRSRRAIGVAVRCVVWQSEKAPFWRRFKR